MTIEYWFESAYIGDVQFLHDNVFQFAQQKNKVGNTALMIAVLNDDAEAVGVLASAECCVQNARSETALYLAIKRKNIKTVKALAQYEYFIESFQVLPIFHCLNYDFVEAAKCIAPFCRSRDNYMNRFGQTPYTRAIDEKRFAFIEALGQQFGDVQDEFQMHPIIRALQTANEKIVHTVFANSNFNPNRPLLYEAYRNAVVLNSDILFDKYAKAVGPQQTTALMAICAYTRKAQFTYAELDVLDVLARQEATMTDDFGCTALMYAVQTGKQQLVELLVSREQRISDKHGHTALMKAVIYENLDAMRVLRNYEKGMFDNCGNTALKMAVELDYIEAVDILYQEIVTDNGPNNAIYRAVVKGNAEAVKKLGVGFSSYNPTQKSDYFEITAKLELMQSMRDVIRSGVDYYQVKEKILERHSTWDDV